MRRTIIGIIVSGMVAGVGCPRGGTEAPRSAPASPTACEEGKVWSCYELGKKYAADKKSPQAKIQARRYFKTACDGGLATGCDELRRTDEALCGNGIPDACYHLGEMYRLGNKATKADPVQARTYYKAACTEGVAGACFRLGVLWLEGKGGPSDETRGKYYLGEACKARHAGACKRLGR
jgi:TPR repeat protein